MALQKTVSTEYGVDVTFWNISNVTVNIVEQKLLIILSGYVDATAFQNGSAALKSISFQMSFSDLGLQAIAGLQSQVENFAINNIEDLDGATSV